MNILFIAHERDLNGASFSMLDLIKCLESKHKFIVLCRFNSGAFWDELSNRNIARVYIPYKWWTSYNPPSMIHFLVRKLKWKFLWKWKNCYFIYRNKNLLKKLNIDIIHVNSSVIPIGCDIKRVLKVPLIWHIREFGIVDFKQYPLVSQQKYYKTFQKNADQIIAISKAVAQNYIEHIDHCPINVIYNGVRKNVFSCNDDKQAATNTFKLLIAGAICKGKGQDVALKAMIELHNRGYHDIELFIAGKGEISQFNLDFSQVQKQITVLGQVNELSKYRKIINVELMCSISEAFGRVTIEAMMSGIPVIGTNSGGTKEIIKDGVNGFLFEYGDFTKLADLIQTLYHDRKLLTQIGENAIEYANKNFSIEICAEKINELYMKTLN